MKGGNLVQLTQRAMQTKEIVTTLRSEIAVLTLNLVKEAHERESKWLLTENEQLRKEIELWKGRLVQLEMRNGVVQVSLPGASVRQETVTVKEESPQLQTDVTPEEPQTKKQKLKKGDQGKTEKKSNKPEKQAGPPSDDNKPVDVSRLDLRIGRIVGVEKHKDADSLYVEQVELGEEKPRTVVSGLVKFVPLEEMQNRLVVLLCNLKPAKMRGITSEAMVMCASTPEKVEILSPPEGSQPGDRVTVEGCAGEPDEILNPKKKIFEQVAPDLKTDDKCLATYKGKPFTVAGKGVVKSATLANVQIK